MRFCINVLSIVSSKSSIEKDDGQVMTENKQVLSESKAVFPSLGDFPLVIE